MKHLILLAISIILLSGCITIDSPYGKINAENDSQIFTYTDTDLTVDKDTLKADDTAIIIIGVKSSDKDVKLEDLFTKSMKEIKEIFETRKLVHESWTIRY